ncbi:type III toxin-antitoxin system TenpIN family toxin [Enterobacter ludwigii]|uniref:type III toxin-antitoxin system TenpIN family toxin n=1 Tax=Enterobacter ludwigii TaxID=299767 RepID=UPI003FCFDE3E
MELKKLDESFYTDNPVVIQALDFNTEKNEWMSHGGKVRGHGIVQIELGGLVFAIPVRSTIKHDASFILEVNRGSDKSNKGMGLDYSKALLIRKAGHVSNNVFVLRTKESGKKLQGKQEHIKRKFTKYVERYVKAVQNGDKNILNDSEYRFSTLVNYHPELGLP